MNLFIDIKFIKIAIFMIYFSFKAIILGTGEPGESGENGHLAALVKTLPVLLCTKLANLTVAGNCGNGHVS